MIYLNDEAISYSDVTIQTQYSDLDSRSDVDLSTKLYSYPFMGTPMYHVDTNDMYKFFESQNIPFILHRYFPNVEAQINRIKDITRGFLRYDSKHLIVAVGTDEKWIYELIYAGVKSFCVDVANGNSKQAIKAVKFIKDNCPDAMIIAGNIETYDGFKRLYDVGTNGYRVGISSGSICSTNINTGNGLPILTALQEISSKMTDKERTNSILIADGGIRTAGDVAKALAFGADYVMCGKLFAATSYAKGPFFNDEMITLDKDYTDINIIPAFVEYAGMASKMMREMAGGSQKTNVSEEGHGGLIEYTGTTENVFNQIILNLKAVLAYSGCRNIEEFKKNVIIRRISAGGKFEKQIHLSKVYR